MTVNIPSPASSLQQDMAGRIRRAFEAWENRPDVAELKINRLVLPMDPVDPLDWLSQQSAEVKVFWSGREDDQETAGTGVADLIVGSFSDHPDELIGRCRSYLSENPGLRYFGGFAFQEEGRDEGWQHFGPSRFHIPRFEVIRTGDSSAFVCNLIFRRSLPMQMEDLLDELNRLSFDIGSIEHPVVTVVERHDYPDKAGWSGNVLSALDMMQLEVLDKIVLAREVSFQCEQVIDGSSLLARLKPITPNVYHFALQPDRSVCFIGATPERLMQRKDKWVWSEAVAGTRPRGLHAQEDDVLAQELLTSKKDHLEHDIVRKSIRQRLHLLCDSLQVDEHVRLLRLTTKQHLFSGVKGRLRNGVSDGDLIQSLHPTPAVGGYPTENALSEIKRLEPFCRGWYAGPIGWISRDAAEFAVAIRSGLIEGSRLSLFSGAGIVQGSTPEAEWDEIENKITDFLTVMESE